MKPQREKEQRTANPPQSHKGPEPGKGAPRPAPGSAPSTKYPDPKIGKR